MTTINNPETNPNWRAASEITPVHNAKPRRRKALKIIGGVLAVTGAIGSAFLVGQNQPEKSDKVTATAPKASEPKTNPNNEKSSIEKIDKSYGNIFLGRILPGDKTITTTRDIELSEPEVVTLPLIRSFGSEESIAESCLALLAGYLTTGDGALLDAMTDNQEVRDGIQQWRNKSKSTAKGVQTIFFDSYDNPATFSREEVNGETLIKLTGGSLYYERSVFVGEPERNRWQSPDTRLYDTELKFVELEFSLIQERNQFLINGMKYHYVANPDSKESD